MEEIQRQLGKKGSEEEMARLKEQCYRENVHYGIEVGGEHYMACVKKGRGVGEQQVQSEPVSSPTN